MKEHRNENAFWQDVLGRVEQARADPPEPVSLEEAERRMAEAAEEERLSDAAVARMVAAATRPRTVGLDRGGGRLLTFPTWTRRAVAAGLVLAPLVAVAFWKAFDDKRQRPLRDYQTAVDHLLHVDAARDAARVLQDQAAQAGRAVEDLEQWTADYREECQTRVFSFVEDSIRLLMPMQSEAGDLGLVVQSSISDLTAALDAPLVETTKIAPEPILSLLQEIAATATTANRKAQLIRRVGPQLEVGIFALRRTAQEEGDLGRSGQSYVGQLRTLLR